MRRKGSSKPSNSFFSLVINTAFGLDAASCSNILSASLRSAIIGFIHAAQAAFLPSLTAFLMVRSIAVSSSSVAMLFSIIQRRICTLQSYSASHAKRSLFL